MKKYIIIAFILITSLVYLNQNDKISYLEIKTIYRYEDGSKFTTSDLLPLQATKFIYYCDSNKIVSLYNINLNSKQFTKYRNGMAIYFVNGMVYRDDGAIIVSYEHGIDKTECLISENDIRFLRLLENVGIKKIVIGDININVSKTEAQYIRTSIGKILKQF
jgi:hypothetical protein